MIPSKILAGAHGYVQHGWTKNCFARNKHGNPAAPTSELACCWCVTGACYAAAGINIDAPLLPALHAAFNYLRQVKGLPIEPNPYVPISGLFPINDAGFKQYALDWLTQAKELAELGGE